MAIRYIEILHISGCMFPPRVVLIDPDLENNNDSNDESSEESDDESVSSTLPSTIQ